MHSSHLESQRCSITTQKWTLATWIWTLANWRWILVTWRWTLATQSTLQDIHSPSPGCKNPSRVHLIIYVARVHFQAAKAHHQVARVHLPVARVHLQVTRVHFQVTRVHLQVDIGHRPFIGYQRPSPGYQRPLLGVQSLSPSSYSPFPGGYSPFPCVQYPSYASRIILQGYKFHLQVPRESQTISKYPVYLQVQVPASTQSPSPGTPRQGSICKYSKSFSRYAEAISRCPQSISRVERRANMEECLVTAGNSPNLSKILRKQFFLTIPLTQNWTHQ